MKPSHYDAAVSIFHGSGVLIEGKCHLGVALGTASFVSSFVSQKVSVWKHEYNQLEVWLIYLQHNHMQLMLLLHMVLVGGTIWSDAFLT